MGLSKGSLPYFRTSASSTYHARLIRTYKNKRAFQPVIRAPSPPSLATAPPSDPRSGAQTANSRSRPDNSQAPSARPFLSLGSRLPCILGLHSAANMRLTKTIVFPTCVGLYVSICAYLSANMFVCMCVYLFAYVCVCVNVSVFVLRGTYYQSHVSYPTKHLNEINHNQTTSN